MDYLIMHNTCSGKEIRYIGTAESMVRRSSTLFYHKCKKRDMFSIDISSMIPQGGSFIASFQRYSVSSEISRFQILHGDSGFL